MEHTHELEQIESLEHEETFLQVVNTVFYESAVSNQRVVHVENVEHARDIEHIENVESTRNFGGPMRGVVENEDEATISGLGETYTEEEERENPEKEARWSSKQEAKGRRNRHAARY
jgi:hypothetical protein